MDAQATLQIVLKARDEASEQIKRVGNTTQKMGDTIKESFKAAGLASAGLLTALGAVSKSALDSAAKFEQSTVAFTTLLGDQAKAVKFLDQMKKDAAATPFELQGLVDMNQRLIGAGLSAEKARQTVLQLGDALASTGAGSAEMTRIGNTIAQVFGKGKADAVDFKELVNAGWVSVKQDVSSALGVTRAQFEDMISAGEIGFDDLSGVLTKLTGQGGKFFGAMANQSQTLSGRISTLKDNFNIFLGNMATQTGLFDAAKRAIELLIAGVDILGPKLIELANFLSQNQLALYAVAGVITGLVILALGALVSSMAGVVLTMGIFSAAGAALGAVAFVIASNWGKLQPIFQPLIDTFVDFGARVAPLFLEAWNNIVSTLLAGLTFVQAVWNQAWPAIHLTFFTVWEMIKGTLKVAWGAVQLLITTGLALISGDWSKAWEGMKVALATIWEGIKGVVKAGANYIISIVNTIIDAINSIKIDIPGFDVMGKKFGGFKWNGANLGKVPLFENGGWVNQDTLAYLHGGEFVLSRDMLSGSQPVPQQVSQTTNNPISIQAVIQNPMDIDLLGYRLAWALRNNR